MCRAYAYRWDVGPWQGDAACGTQATLTRDMTCLGHAEGGGSADGLSDALTLPGASAALAGGDADEVLDSTLLR